MAKKRKKLPQAQAVELPVSEAEPVVEVSQLSEVAPEPSEDTVITEPTVEPVETNNNEETQEPVFMGVDLGTEPSQTVETEIVVTEDVAEEPKSDEVILHFARPVEVGINGVWYRGKEITCPNHEIANEIRRIAMNTYGSDILA